MDRLWSSGGSGGGSTERRFARPQFTAVILSDVESKRQALYSITNDVPQSLLPVANRPLLQYQLDLLAASRFSGQEAHFCSSLLNLPA
jgi:hypothetical protein